MWKLSRKFCSSIYKVTSKFPEAEKFGLVSQLRRASISVPSNIAEGSAKSSDKHFLVFLETSLGSCYEMETQLLVSNDLEFINDETLADLLKLLETNIQMLSKFMSYLKGKL
ncbi:four helix bundle protein [Flavobacterium sp.]|uniref:four helix bundle protein n=1 Tax=Flavobacterium sp. TaxID=239 RepID=UPI00286DA88A|nr:four helix bundle protein [Flavobacterium sp.]